MKAKLACIAVISLFFVAILYFWGCASSASNLDNPDGGDSYLTINDLNGTPGLDGAKQQGVLYSDCWKDLSAKEADPSDPSKTRNCCVPGSGTFLDDNLSLTVTNNGKTGDEGPFQTVHMESYRITYNTGGSPIGQPFFDALPGVENQDVADVVEGTLDLTIEVETSATVNVLAVPLERKPSYTGGAGGCETFIFPARITLYGTDLTGSSLSVSSSFQVHFSQWEGTACVGLPACGSCPFMSVVLEADASTVTVGTATEFTATVSGGAFDYTYEWDFDNNGTVDLTNTNRPTSDTVNFTYGLGLNQCRVTVTDSCGAGAQTATSTASVTVTP